MADDRLRCYREAAEALKKGDFKIQVPIEKDDDIGLLGKQLLELRDILERKFEETRMLAQVTAEVNAGFILDEVLDHVYRSFKPLIPYDRIGFSLLTEDGEMVRARWAKTSAEGMEITKGYEAPLEGSSLQRIIETGEPRILNNLEDYLNGLVRWRPAFGRSRTRDYACFG